MVQGALTRLTMRHSWNEMAPWTRSMNIRVAAGALPRRRELGVRYPSRYLAYHMTEFRGVPSTQGATSKIFTSFRFGAAHMAIFDAISFFEGWKII